MVALISREYSRISLLVALISCEYSNDIAQNVQQGYESRHIVGAVWMQSLIALINTDENCVNAALQATMGCAFNAMPVTEVCLARVAVCIEFV